MLIPDVPAHVKEDEFRRELIVEQVQKELNEVKMKGGYESFQDMTDRLQREVTKIMEEQAKREAAEEEAGLSTDKEKKKLAKRRAI